MAPKGQGGLEPLKLSGKRTERRIGEVPYFKQDQSTCLSCTLSFSHFCRAVDKKETENGSCIAIFSATR